MDSEGLLSLPDDHGGDGDGVGFGSGSTADTQGPDSSAFVPLGWG